MPAAIDATGHRYGRLTAIAPVKTPKGAPRRWKFLCDCGVEQTAPLRLVRFGTVRSCGCLRRETTAVLRTRDFAGVVIGRLTVQSPGPRDDAGRLTWQCLCACGVAVLLTSSVLGRKNPTKSCGCLQRESAAAARRAEKQDNPISRTPEYRAAMRKKIRSVPERAMAERVSRMLAWALASIGAVKRGRTFDLLGYTPAALRAHLEKQFLPGMSWSNRGNWEVDHIVPISSARCEADVIALNQLSNLRPLWAADNNEKKDRRDFLI